MKPTDAADEVRSRSQQHLRPPVRRRITLEQPVRFLAEPPRHIHKNVAAVEAFYTFNIVGALLCVAMVALISGLFLGLLTLDSLDLQIIQRASLDAEERLYATTLLPVIQKRHQILVTLLLMNALAYETLPIFLDALVPSWVAILLSVTIVMLFGEILPSGIFMGPNQLYLGYKMVPIIRGFLWIFYPVAMPLAKLLDYMTDAGDNTAHGAYNRSELSALVRIQHEAELGHRGTSRLRRVLKKDRSKDQTWAALKAEIMERVAEKNSNTGHENQQEENDEAQVADKFMLHLHKREVCMVEGALQMKTVHAMDVYTPFTGVYSVSDELVLDQRNITTIYGHGYSRVPVYRANPADPDDCTQVMGFLITRQLMLIDWEDERQISTLPLQRPTCVSPRMNLIDLFEVLQKTGPMLTFVCARPDLANKALKALNPIPVEAGLMGIITLVDVMESIIQDRIYDERDTRDRDRAVATLNRWAATLVVNFMRKSTHRKKLARQRSGGGAGTGSVPLFGESPQPSFDAMDPLPSKGSHGESTPLLEASHDESTPLLEANNGTKRRSYSSDLDY